MEQENQDPTVVIYTDGDYRKERLAEALTQSQPHFYLVNGRFRTLEKPSKWEAPLITDNIDLADEAIELARRLYRSIMNNDYYDDDQARADGTLLDYLTNQLESSQDWKQHYE